MPRPQTRCTAIALERRPDRWSACEDYLRTVVPTAEVPLDIFAGSDAKATIAGAAAGEERIAALEDGLGCRIYREWPITEIADVRRCYPQLRGTNDALCWIGYQKAVAACFRPDRARLYHDFFMRHLSIGEMGASISHLRVIERAHTEQLDLQIIFEDDARPTAEAVPRLLEEVDRLRAAGVSWDLIYLHSANYGRRAEVAVDHHPDSVLRYAGHRRVTHAYALSRAGIARIATCGYREATFPFDDFLSCLHAGHPRPDIMALPCVRAARGEPPLSQDMDCDDDGVKEGDRQIEEGQDEDCNTKEDEAAAGARAGTLPAHGFVGLTFPDEPPLCIVPVRGAAGADFLLDSDSKVGHGSAVLLGDGGANAYVEDDNDEGEGVEGGGRGADAAAASEAAPAGAADATAAGVTAGVERLPCAPISWADLEAGGDVIGAAVHAQLAKHGYLRVRVSGADLGTLLAAEEASTGFFESRSLADKTAHAGRGGRLNALMLWSCGYSSWPGLREQWHVVCGATEAQPWPEPESAAERQTGGLREPLLCAEALLRRISMAILAAATRTAAAATATAGAVAGAGCSAGAGAPATDGGALAVLEAACEGVGAGTDPSVMDAFHYVAGGDAGSVPAEEVPATDSGGRATETDGASLAMAAHFDPGVLTLTRVSDVPGLQVRDPSMGAWVALEEHGAADEVLVLAGEQLAEASGGKLHAASHRVAKPPATRRGEARSSVVFELRAPGVL